MCACVCVCPPRCLSWWVCDKLVCTVPFGKAFCMSVYVCCKLVLLVKLSNISYGTVSTLVAGGFLRDERWKCYWKLIHSGLPPNKKFRIVNVCAIKSALKTTVWLQKVIRKWKDIFVQKVVKVWKNVQVNKWRSYATNWINIHHHRQNHHQELF